MQWSLPYMAVFAGLLLLALTLLTHLPRGLADDELWGMCQASNEARGVAHEMSNLRARAAVAAARKQGLLLLPVPLGRVHNRGRGSALGPRDGMFNYSDFTDDRGVRLSIFEARGNERCPFSCQNHQRKTKTLPSGVRVLVCRRSLTVRDLLPGAPGPWVSRRVEVWSTLQRSMLLRDDLKGLMLESVNGGIRCSLHRDVKRVAALAARQLLGSHGNYTALHVRGGDVRGASKRFFSPGNVARVLGASRGPVFVMGNEPRSVLTAMLSELRGRRAVVLSHDVERLPAVKRVVRRNNYVQYLVESEMLRMATRRLTTFAGDSGAYTNATFWHGSLGGRGAGDVLRRDQTGQICGGGRVTFQTGAGATLRHRGDRGGNGSDSPAADSESGRGGGHLFASAASAISAAGNSSAGAGTVLSALP